MRIGLSPSSVPCDLVFLTDSALHTIDVTSSDFLYFPQLLLGGAQGKVPEKRVWMDILGNPTTNKGHGLPSYLLVEMPVRCLVLPDHKRYSLHKLSCPCHRTGGGGGEVFWSEAVGAWENH